MGTVVDELEDESGNSTSYVVETDYGERMRFPVDQFEVTERGLIYRPLWKEALEKQVDTLEERIRAGETGDSMIVARILNLKNVNPEAIKTLKAQHPEQSDIFEAFAGLIALYRELKQRIEVLEVERLRARSDLTLHAGERLLKHNSRREFAKLVLAERRRYQICDINIKHVNELLKRLYDSPYFPEKLFPPLDHDDTTGEDPLAQTSSPAHPASKAGPPEPPQPTRDQVPHTQEQQTQPNPPLPDGVAGPPMDTKTEVELPTRTERSGPRVTFTPPPDQLRQGNQRNQEGLQSGEATGTDSSRTPISSQSDAQNSSGPARSIPPNPGSRASSSLNRDGAGGPWQAHQNRNLDGQPPRRQGSSGGVASQFQGLINRGQANGPMNMAVPGVANSMLSFVNDVRNGGRATPSSKKPRGAGQALVLNLGGQGQKQGQN